MPEYRADPDLLPIERETYFRFADDEDQLTIHSDNPHVSHRLIEHPHFEETRRYSTDGTVHGVEGRLPLGCLLIRRDPRSSGGHADVVTAEVLKEAEA